MASLSFQLRTNNVTSTEERILKQERKEVRKKTHEEIKSIEELKNILIHFVFYLTMMKVVRIIYRLIAWTEVNWNEEGLRNDTVLQGVHIFNRFSTLRLIEGELLTENT